MGTMTWHGLPVITGQAWPGLRYFCTLRMPQEMSGGVRPAAAPQALGASKTPYDSFNLGDHVGDEAGAVQANRDRLAAALPASPIWLKQVHGVDVFDADGDADAGGAVNGQGSGRHVERHARLSGAEPPVADAAVTSVPGRVLCIMTADCLPVLLSDGDATVLGLAHAGWRGLAAGVLENTLAALRRRAPAAASWRAWIGPAIGQASFEVGDEVRRAFTRQDAQAASYFAAGRPDRWQADLAGLAARRLKQAGVAHVESSGLCTHARPELFYSYRRDGATGRMATVAWLDAGA